MAVPSGYHTVNGVLPRGGGPAEFYVSIKKLQDLERSGPRTRFYDSLLLPEGLSKPTAVFQGLEREGYEENAYCYCSKPAKRYQSASIEVPFPPNRVFLIFVEERESGFFVLDWEKRPEDQNHLGYPEQWGEDFSRQIYGRPD